MKLTLPLHVFLPRKTVKDKKIILNLNNYRNWHHSISNDAKIQFCEAMRGQLEGVTLKHPIQLSYTLYTASNRRIDTMNCLSIQNKFLEDAMVHYGCIPDDNSGVITLHTFKSAGKSDNPRCEVTIKEV